MTFPSSCIRGITKEKWIMPSQRVFGLAFEPDERTVNDRDDNYVETSIHWEDNEEVLNFCFTNLKSNFTFGAVRLPLEGIHQVISGLEKIDLRYERDRLPENEYHGNLLFHMSNSRKVRNHIATVLSFHCSKVISHEKRNK